jgi:hypothetical protein
MKIGQGMPNHCIRQFEWQVSRKAQIEEDRRNRQLQIEREGRDRQQQLEQARVDRLLNEAASLRQAMDVVFSKKLVNRSAAQPRPPPRTY